MLKKKFFCFDKKTAFVKEVEVEVEVFCYTLANTKSMNGTLEQPMQHQHPASQSPLPKDAQVTDETH